MSASNLTIDFSLHQKQGLVLHSKATEILYGGAAGGGKSHMSRVLSILWALEIAGIQIYFFRRLYDDLIKNHIEGPTGFRSMLHPWLNNRHPKSPLIGQKLCEVVEGEIRFWNGSKIFLCHLQHQKDLTKYYGPEFHVLIIEEATQFTEYMVRFLRSRMRIPTSLKIPDKYLKPREEWADPNVASYYFPRAIYTSNPGGVGHSYFKRGFMDKRKQLEYFIAPESDGGHVRQYIPAKLTDNNSVNREEYRKSLKGLPPNLVNAMLEGDWNAVIGAFFPEIDTDKHLIKPFSIPHHWTRIMSMDWGACGEGDPFSIGWWAVSDGTIPLYPRNSIICHKTWYGKGLPKVTATQVAEGILRREQNDVKPILRVVGGDVDEKKGHGESLFEIFANNGVIFNKADKRRQPSHLQMRERLVGKDDKPMIYWFNTFAHELETISNLQHDPNDVNDCTDHEDHIYEQTRYALMARPWVRDKPASETAFVEKFKKPTLNDMWSLVDQQKDHRY